MLRVFKILVPALILLAGCQRKSDPPPPPPDCQTGVNQQACSDGIRGQSFWGSELSIYEGSGKSEKLKEVVNVYYEFTGERPQPHLRRYLTRTRGNQVLTVIQFGQITSIDSEHISFNIDRSTCDDERPSSDDIYFLRLDRGSLQTDGAHIDRPKPITIHNFGDIFTMPIQIMMQGMIDAIAHMPAEMVAQMFNTSPDPYLTMLSTKRRSFNAIDEKAMKIGTVGCLRGDNDFREMGRF